MGVSDVSLTIFFGEHQQATFAMLCKFWLLRGWVGLIESAQKRNLWWKSFFKFNVEWSSKKLWKVKTADVKVNVKQ